MGGSGSTRWDYHSKKDTVEACYSIGANYWMREGVLRAGVHAWGSMTWRDSETDEQTSSISYEVNTVNPAFSWVRLYYTLTRTGERMDYRIRLVTTQPNFGGLRWWFICPLVVNSRGCDRRVGKIYLPPGGKYYGCRHCYDLTYTSSQESDKRVSWLRRNPEALHALVNNCDNVDSSRLFLAMKALRW